MYTVDFRKQKTDKASFKTMQFRRLFAYAKHRFSRAGEAQMKKNKRIILESFELENKYLFLKWYFYLWLKAHVHLSRDVRKPDFCICENKDADQLRGNREADQRLCFRYTDSTIPLLPKSEILSL